MSVPQAFSTALKTDSSHDRCESSVVLRRSWNCWRTLGRLFLLILFAVLSPDRAFASCGAYLHTRTSSPAVSIVRQAIQVIATEHNEGTIPCSGPECRSIPRSSAIPPAIPGIFVRSSESAMVDSGILVESSDARDVFVRISSARVARGFPAQIDVPPECI